MKVLLFMGAGASVELGIPAMRAMARDLHSHLANQRLSPTVLERFEAMLSEADYDIEHLIEAVDGIVGGTEQQKKLGFPVNEELGDVACVMRQEAEWYVQHVCERLREVDARVLWSAALRRTAGHEICFATTNYDRSLEIGGRFSDVTIDDGFELFAGQEIVRWKGIDSSSALRLLKMHGSTDWYRGSDGRIYKLRHPMPLYGNLAVTEDGIKRPRMTSALVLPTREKRVNHPPYPDLVTSFRNAARTSEVAIFLGTSLRDPDIADICRQCAERIPTYFVSKDRVPENVASFPGLKVVAQMAGKFIASSLPKFLSTLDAKVLEENAVSTDGEHASILQWLVTIQDLNRKPEEICSAIENLSDSDVALDVATLDPLLRHENSTVASYAVALIDKSLDRAEVMELAEELAGREPKGLLATELAMLRKLVASGETAVAAGVV